MSPRMLLRDVPEGCLFTLDESEWGDWSTGRCLVANGQTPIFTRAGPASERYAATIWVAPSSYADGAARPEFRLDTVVRVVDDIDDKWLDMALDEVEMHRRFLREGVIACTEGFLDDDVTGPSK